MYTPIASPEYKFQPREVHSSDPKTGSSSTGIPQPEQAQQGLLLENSITVPQTPIEIPLDEPDLVIEKVAKEQNQDQVSAIGLTASSLIVASQLREGMITEVTGTITCSSEGTRRAIRNARRVIWEQTGYIPPLTGGSEIIGKPGFRWKRELSEDGRKLYSLLLSEMGDIDLLPTYATEYKFDLTAALNELRKHGLVDESNPRVIRIIRKPI